jgi:hypothetical protein
MSVWPRACATLGIVAALLVSCSGEEFTSAGSAGADAAAGSGGAGAACGSGGAGGAIVGDCTNDLFCKTCEQVNTAVVSCDECARSRCCNEALACMQDLACSRQMSCYFRRCTNRSATECFKEHCLECKQSFGLFLLLSACISRECKTSDSGLDPCPHLIP